MYLDHPKVWLMTAVLVVLFLSSCKKAAVPPLTMLPPDGPLPVSLKGYELYSWTVGREWYFTLVTGTNRPKTLEEIFYDENAVGEQWTRVTVCGVHDIQAVFDQLDPGTEVFWLGARAVRQRGGQPGQLALPPAKLVKEIQAYAALVDVYLDVVER